MLPRDSEHTAIASEDPGLAPPRIHHWCVLLPLGQWHRWFAYGAGLFGRNTVLPEDLWKLLKLHLHEDSFWWVAIATVGKALHCVLETAVRLCL